MVRVHHVHLYCRNCDRSVRYTYILTWKGDFTGEIIAAWSALFGAQRDCESSWPTKRTNVARRPRGLRRNRARAARTSRAKNKRATIVANSNRKLHQPSLVTCWVVMRFLCLVPKQQTESCCGRMIYNLVKCIVTCDSDATSRGICGEKHVSWNASTVHF